MTNKLVFSQGQRWYSEAEPELGLGVIELVQDKLITVYYSHSDLSRTYSTQNPPLKRFILSIGDEASIESGESFVVDDFIEIEHLYIYKSGDAQIPETLLAAKIDLSGPLERLLVQNFDDHRFHELRYQSYLAYRNYEQFPLKGLIGAKVKHIPHQIYIANEILNMSSPKVMLCDEVGLGKTIEAALVAHALIKREVVSNVLIIVPESLTHQWFIELYKKFSLSFKTVTEETVENLDESESQSFIIGSNLLKEESNLSTKISNIKWDMIIVDESHQIAFKNKDNFLANFIRKITGRAFSALFLSATPEVMGEENLFSQLQVIDPQKYNNFTQFQDQAQSFKALSDEIKNYLDHGNITKKLESYFDSSEQVDFNDKELVINKLIDRFGSGRSYFRNSRTNLASQKLFNQRVLHAHPIEKPKKLDDRTAFKIKAETIYEILIKYPNEKVLILCQSKELVKNLNTSLMQLENFKIAQFHSEQSLIERDRQSAYFSDPDGARILIGTQVGSEGRNFEFASHMILFDLPKLPDQLEQRIGRLDRIGQKNNINIHVPYIKESFEEILFSWYKDVLGAFENFAKGAHTFYEENKESLLKLIENPSTKDKDETLNALQKKFLVKQKELENGRNFLVEYRSFDQAIAKEAIKTINEFEQGSSCKDFLESVCNEVGVEMEELNQHSFFLKPSDNMLLPSYPGLTSEGMSVSFNRDYTHLHQNIDYMSWEHPIIKAAFEIIMSSSLGNLSIVQTDQLPRNIYFEYIIILETQNQNKFLSARYMPYTPLRVLLDIQGNELTSKISRKMLASIPFEKVSDEKLLFFKQMPKDELVKLSKQAQICVAQREKKLKQKALTEIELELNKEYDRLQGLAASESEFEKLKVKKQELFTSIEEATPRLDSMRVILPTE